MDELAVKAKRSWKGRTRYLYREGRKRSEVIWPADLHARAVVAAEHRRMALSELVIEAVELWMKHER